MSDQLTLGAEHSRTDHATGAVISTVDCGTNGTIRVELVLVERKGYPDVEIVKLVEGGRHQTVPIDQLQPLLQSLSRALDFSEKRRARRAKR